MTIKKIAICFWGSFSREDQPQKNKLLTKDYLSKTAVKICTQTILNSLPQNIDLYSHSWTNWANKTSLKFEDSIIEDNQLVMKNALKCIDSEVKKLSKSKLIISERNNIRFWNKQGLANQMSAAISRSRVLKLLEKKIDLYEGIVLIRPDLISLNQIINLMFKKGTISVNASPSTIYGDFIFSIKPNEIFVFHKYAEIEKNKPIYYLPHYGFPQFLRKYNLKITKTKVTAGRDIEVYRKAYIPFILHEKKIPVILNHESIKYIKKIANNPIFKKEMIIIKNSQEKFKNAICSNKEKLIDYLKLTSDYYILGFKIPTFDEILCSYNLDDFLLIAPNLLLSKIVNNSPINEIEKTIKFINDNLDEVTQISKNSLISARSLLMITIWINHFKFNNLEPYGDFRCSQIILYRLRDIFINLGDSVNCQLVELFIDTEYGYKTFSPISYCP